MNTRRHTSQWGRIHVLDDHGNVTKIFNLNNMGCLLHKFPKKAPRNLFKELCQYNLPGSESSNRQIDTQQMLNGMPDQQWNQKPDPNIRKPRLIFPLLSDEKMPQIEYISKSILNLDFTTFKNVEIILPKLVMPNIKINRDSP